MKGISFSRIYRLFMMEFVLGISVSVSDHEHLVEDEIRTGIPPINEWVITIECLIWGVDIMIPRGKRGS